MFRTVIPAVALALSACSSDDSGSGTTGTDTSTGTPTSGSTSTAPGTSTGPGDSSGSSTAGADPPVVIFVNFDGGEFMMGMDDATTDTTQIPALVGLVDAYGGDEAARSTIVEAVRGHYAAFNVEVVDARPQDGDYTMAVVTPTNPFGAAFTGIAAADCNNEVLNNIAFAFTDAEVSPAQTAAVASSRCAASFGLSDVTGMADLMATDVQADGEFTDGCAPTELGLVCPSEAGMPCPEDEQNSFQELVAILGPA